MSDLMCNSILLSSVLPLPFVSVNFSLQNRGVFCPTLFLLLLIVRKAKGKGKAIPVQAVKAPWRLKLPESLDNRIMKVVILSALCTGRLDPPGSILGTHFCQRLS